MPNDLLWIKFRLFDQLTKKQTNWLNSFGTQLTQPEKTDNDHKIGAHVPKMSIPYKGKNQECLVINEVWQNLIIWLHYEAMERK